VNAALCVVTALALAAFLRPPAGSAS
jgi:hypothetical protein